MAEVVDIFDTVSPAGHRITTFHIRGTGVDMQQITRHRNASHGWESFRAIPSHLITGRGLYTPPRWPQNKGGMATANNADVWNRAHCEDVWDRATTAAMRYHQELTGEQLPDDERVAKEVANRLLEPFVIRNGLITWCHTHRKLMLVRGKLAIRNMAPLEDFFALRINPEAQTDIADLARQMKAAVEDNKPARVEDHLPFTTASEIKSHGVAVMRAASAARCARVSTVAFGKDKGIEADLRTYSRLYALRHLGPLEHVSMAADVTAANFTGWWTLREQLEYNANPLEYLQEGEVKNSHWFPKMDVWKEHK